MSLPEIIGTVICVIIVLFFVGIALNPKKKTVKVKSETKTKKHDDEHAKEKGKEDHGGGGHGDHGHGNGMTGVVVRLGILVVIIMLIGYFTIPLVVSAFKTSEEHPTYQKFLISGKGIATKEKPIKAYMDPLKTSIMVLGKGEAKYVLASDANIFFVCNQKAEQGGDDYLKPWWQMPEGNYLVYPNDRDTIMFSWRQ